MLIKISLALALVVSLVTLYFAHDQVGGKIGTLNTDLTDANAARETAQSAATKASAEKKALETQLTSTNKAFEEVTKVLGMALTTATEQKARADKAIADLTKTTEEKVESNRELSAWKSLNMSVDQIRPLRDERDKAVAARDAYSEENKVFARNARVMKAELDKYKETEEVEVALPAGTKGQVVAVDPKFDFVVLNIGGNQGLVQNAKMLVNRNGKLIAKVKIITVEPNRSIANILADWKQDDVLEGDQVFY